MNAFPRYVSMNMAQSVSSAYIIKSNMQCTSCGIGCFVFARTMRHLMAADERAGGAGHRATDIHVYSQYSQLCTVKAICSYECIEGFTLRCTVASRFERRSPDSTHLQAISLSYLCLQKNCSRYFVQRRDGYVIYIVCFMSL